jgi:hypothetical protein
MRRLLSLAFAAVMLVAVYETGHVHYALHARQFQAQMVDSDEALRADAINHAVIASALDQPTLPDAVVVTVDRSRFA